MLRHPIPLQPAPLPWLVRLNRQGVAGWWRRGGKLWPKVAAPVAAVLSGRSH
jgi:hypothetical protein